MVVFGVSASEVFLHDAHCRFVIPCGILAVAHGAVGSVDFVLGITHVLPLSFQRFLLLLRSGVQNALPRLEFLRRSE